MRIINHICVLHVVATDTCWMIVQTPMKTCRNWVAGQDWVNTFLETLSEKERLSVVYCKSDCQFGHLAKERLVTLLKDAGKWNVSYKSVLDAIYDSCKTC